MGIEAMKPRPGPVRQDGDFYTRPNTRNINNISINGKGRISFGGFDKYSESLIESINSLRMFKDGKVSVEEAFYYARYTLKTSSKYQEYNEMQPQINDQYPNDGAFLSLKGMILGQ